MQYLQCNDAVPEEVRRRLAVYAKSESVRGKKNGNGMPAAAFAIAVIAALAFCPSSPVARADSITLTNGISGEAHVKVVSYRDMPFQTVVRQQYDFSCGSAALATLLTFHLERPTDERTVFDAMYAMGDQEKINREGFSLFEMKQYLQSLGYQADGFRVSLDKVARVGVPVIVLIEWKNYKHFVVVKGVEAGYVLIGDPARGNKVMTQKDFMSEWRDGIVFAVRNANQVAQNHFNDPQEWRGRPKSPLGSGRQNPNLTIYNLSLPGGGSKEVF
ncbi:MAG TPA: C39 family peptidase [Dongiaceae bacterium]|nr:C39 family peptidase [Dongiaceae bacterium]